MRNRLVIILLTGFAAICATAQTPLRTLLENYFIGYRASGQIIRAKAHLDSVCINDSLKTVVVHASNAFGEQMFTQQTTDLIYNNIQKLLPDTLQDYQLTVKTGGWPIQDLIPARLRKETTDQRTWGSIDYKGQPWVSNTSLPYRITRGLSNRHFSIWASHGRYYNITEGRWKWQRIPLFGTSEDFFTQTIVTPYLIPMLEKAGAVVFSPRERDWQVNEVIVDNDSTGCGYAENAERHEWQSTQQPGFALHQGNYQDHENPFEAGTARFAETTEHTHGLSTIAYQPTIPEAGRYAVYVSYQTLDNSIDDAHYTVWHKGVATEFRVNQQMGGSTWVY